MTCHIFQVSVKAVVYVTQILTCHVTQVSVKDVVHVTQKLTFYVPVSQVSVKAAVLIHF